MTGNGQFSRNSNSATLQLQFQGLGNNPGQTPTGAPSGGSQPTQGFVTTQAPGGMHYYFVKKKNSVKDQKAFKRQTSLLKSIKVKVCESPGVGHVDGHGKGV